MTWELHPCHILALQPAHSTMTCTEYHDDHSLPWQVFTYKNSLRLPSVFSRKMQFQNKCLKKCKNARFSVFLCENNAVSLSTSVPYHTGHKHYTSSGNRAHTVYISLLQQKIIYETWRLLVVDKFLKYSTESISFCQMSHKNRRFGLVCY